MPLKYKYIFLKKLTKRTLNIETLVINDKIIKVGTINKDIILATEKDYYKITEDKISFLRRQKNNLAKIK